MSEAIHEVVSERVVSGASVDAGPAVAHSGFADVEPRRSVDVLLQVTMQDLVALSGQADLKASIMITAASIVLSVSFAAIRYSSVRWGLGTLMVFALVALAMAILAVLPRGTPTRPGVGMPANPFNPLYFAHAATVSPDEYVDRLGALCADNALLYEGMSRQIHALSVHLETRKFRYLRRAYACMLAGFVFAIAAQLISFAV